MNKVTYIKRDIEPLVLEMAEQYPVVALTGSRQTGKSTLVENLFFTNYSYVSFDDPIILERAKEDPKLFLEDYEGNIIFDEIQYIPELLSYIKMEVDKDRKRKGRFILTGSQQFTMMKDISETLAGRVGIINLLPFSLHEQIRVRDYAALYTTNTERFVHACLRGSYPELIVDPTLEPVKWHGNYVRTYLERDVRSLYNIGKLSEFQRFLGVLANRVSQVLNITAVSREVGVSVNTIKEWISILEASQIIYLLEPYFSNLKKRIIKAPKLYFSDIGLVTYLTGIRSKEHLLYGPLAGPLFENFVMQEVIKIFANRGLIPSIYYIRTLNKLELDLVIEYDLRAYPFEIKLTKSPNKKMVQNIKHIKDSFPQIKFCEGGLVCLNEEKGRLAQNIRIFNPTQMQDFVDNILK